MRYIDDQRCPLMWIVTKSNKCSPSLFKEYEGVDTEVRHLVMHKCVTQPNKYVVLRILPVSLMI